MIKSQEPNKFILFTLEFPPQKGGVGKYYFNLVKYWLGDDLIVLTGGQPQKEDAPNVVRKKLLFKYIFPRWLHSVYHLSFIIYHYRNPYIIIGQILPLGIPTYLLAKIFKFKYSVILHGLDFSMALKRPKLTQKILNKAEKIICANGFTASQVAKFDRNLQNKISTVNPGIESIFVRNPQKVKELKEKYNLTGKEVIFGLGRLVKRKGFDKVIEAFAKISSEAPNLVLVIGGDGEELENLKKSAGEFPGKIIVLGDIDDQEKWAWLELCDIFIMVSRQLAGDYEGFGIVYLEAGLAGKPVIAGDSGGVRDAVFNRVNGLLVNPENTDEIADAILFLYDNEEFRNELGAQGQRRVVETLTARKQADKILQILSEK